jgi:alkanesulfonate monooxygenase SsuD/methylene tetrahydromethanopterin reductase-like flavin-dependent oxidoreductase (luciferase family)
VADYCDGWMPIYRRNHTLAEGVKQLREAASRAGRRFELLTLSVFGVPPREEEAKKLIEIGFHELIFALPPAPADKVLTMLDSYTAIKRKLGA